MKILERLLFTLYSCCLMVILPIALIIGIIICMFGEIYWIITGNKMPVNIASIIAGPIEFHDKWWNKIRPSVWKNK